MIERAQLLALLIDEEVIGILKERLPADQRADLILEIINPYRPLKPERKAALSGVTPRAIRYRKNGK